jgi:hypothetical protein
MNMFKLWMKAATPAEQEQLAAEVGTTRAMLYQYSSPESTNRYPSAERGSDIERVSRKMHVASLGRLPLLYRTDLVEACRKCEYAQKCLGAAAVRADFPFVESEGGLSD